MKITGNVADVELVNLKLSNLKGQESRCSECLEPFDVGDKIIVISDGIVNSNGDIELSEIMHFVKTKAIRDFLTRYIDLLEKSTNKPTDEIVKVQPDN